MSSNASPSPRRRRLSLIIGISAGVLVVAVLGLLVAAWTFPRWGRESTEKRVIAMVEAKLEEDVEVDSFEFDFEQVRMTGVRIGEGIELERLTIDLDPESVRQLHPKVVHVTVTGGSVNRTGDDLEDLLSRLSNLGASDDQDRAEGWRGRVSLMPKSVTIRDVEVNSSAGEVELQGTLLADLDLEEQSVDLALAELSLRRGARSVQGRSIRVETHFDDAFVPTFPLEARLDGFSTKLTNEISVAEVTGTVRAEDPTLTIISVDVAGGFAGEEEGHAGAARGIGDLWALKGSFARDLSRGELDLDMDRFELGRVPQVLERLPLVHSDTATIGGAVSLSFAEGTITADGSVRVDGLNIRHRLLAADTVSDVGFDLDFSGTVDPARRHVQLGEFAIERKGVRLEAEADLIHAPRREDRRYHLVLRVPAVPCQKALDAVPRELAPSLQGVVVTGEFDARVALDVDFADLEGLKLEHEIGLKHCRVKEVPGALSPNRLAGAFTHRVTMRDGRTRSVRMYTGSGSFTGIQQISPNMVAAVLTTEDGSFWRHRGFISSQFEVALRRNLQAGRVRLGASTISMQVVKNVLLSHERTLSRKFQELVLTWYVESVLSKNRIMELYLNAIEFGPGVYGVTRAADHYFGKYPSELTSREAAFLALMLPSPIRRHTHYCKGELSPGMTKKVDRIHGLMLSRGKITAEEHAFGEATPLAFDHSERTSERACLGEISALLEADESQRALSGLLSEEAAAFEDDAAQRAAEVEEEPEPLPLPAVDDEWDPVDPADGDAPGIPAMDLDLDLDVAGALERVEGP